MGNEIVPRKAAMENLRTLFTQNREAIAAAIPRHMDPDRLLRIALTTARNTPRLLDCTPYSVMAAVMQAAQVGLEPDNSLLGHGNLIPFRNKKSGRYEAQFVPGYKGLIDLAMRSGQVVGVMPRVVHEQDTYDWEYGLNPRLSHQPFRPPKDAPEGAAGEVVAFYCVVTLTSGHKEFRWMWKHEVDAIRRQSPAGRMKDGPWVTHYEQMGMKTVVRHTLKYMPLSPEVQRAVAMDEMFDAGIPQPSMPPIDLPETNGDLTTEPDLESLLDEEGEPEADNEEGGNDTDTGLFPEGV